MVRRGGPYLSSLVALRTRHRGVAARDTTRRRLPSLYQVLCDLAPGVDEAIDAADGDEQRLYDIYGGVAARRARLTGATKTKTRTRTAASRHGGRRPTLDLVRLGVPPAHLRLRRHERVGEVRAEQDQSFPRPPPPPLTYLDIGAGLAHKTALVGRQFGVRPRDTVCLEKHGTAFPVESGGGGGGGGATNGGGFTYEYYDGRTLPYPDGSFDLVSCMQVLHHVRTAKGLIREIARVLRPGGVVVVQDHDVPARDEDTKRFLRAVHFLYSSANREGYASLEPSTYRPASQYSEWFARTGVPPLGKPRFRRRRGPMRTFVALFRKDAVATTTTTTTVRRPRRRVTGRKKKGVAHE
jgi:SAM-dependent methyltransferase